MLVDVPVTSLGLQEPVVAASITNSPLEEPSTALATANPSIQDTRLPEPTAVSSAAAPSSEKVILPDSSFASPAVNVHPSEGTHLQEATSSSSIVTTSLSGRYALLPSYFRPFLHCPTHSPFFQGLNLSELLAFDPASIGSAILEADDPQLGPTSTTSRLLRMKDLLLGPINALIQDSSAVKQILDEVNS
jgi:hypothetical protein